MNKIEMVKSTNISELSEKHSDFESLSLSVKSYNNTLKTEELNTNFESDFVDMYLRKFLLPIISAKLKQLKNV